MNISAGIYIIENKCSKNEREIYKLTVPYPAENTSMAGVRTSLSFASNIGCWDSVYSVPENLVKDKTIGILICHLPFSLALPSVLVSLWPLCVAALFL